MAGFFLLCTVVIGNVYGQDDYAGEDNAVVEENGYRGTVFAGVGWCHRRYQEIVLEVIAKGDVIGAMIGYEYRQPSRIYGYIEAYHDEGRFKENWDGEIIWRTYHWEAEGRIGYMFSVDDKYGITPYSGVSYSKIKVSDGEYGTQWERNARWGIPFGVYLSCECSPKFEVGFNAQATLTIWEEGDYFDESSPGFISAKGQYTWGTLFEIPLTYKVNETWNMTLTPMYRETVFSPKTNLENWGTEETKNRYAGVYLTVGYAL
mgnify:FL=1